jgi:tetratricopeptide (TPR) repeat protein
MIKKRYDKASKGYLIRMVSEITLPALLMLMSIAVAVVFADISNSTSNYVSNSNNSYEVLKTIEKAIEINPQDSIAWIYKGNVLSDLNKSDEAIKAYDKALEINPQNS